jgi:hypothetical protein
LLALVAAAMPANVVRRAARTLRVRRGCGDPDLRMGVRNYVSMGEFFTGARPAGHTIWESNNPVTAGIALPIRKSRARRRSSRRRARRRISRLVAAAAIRAGLGNDSARSRELVEHDAYVALARNFVTGNPVLPCAYSDTSSCASSPRNPCPHSVAGGVGALDSIKRAITLGERWFLLAFGTAGLIMLRRSRRETVAAFAIFVVAGLASVFVAYVNARFLLPVTTVLIVPAAFATSRLLARVAPGLVRALSQ